MRSKPIDPKAEPYKVTLDRGLQLRIAPDGKRTLLVRYTVKGSNTERQYRLPQEYGDAPGQRRAKDGLPLKARTKSDYLAAIEPPRVTKVGAKRAAGPLHPIAHKPLANLTASDIRATYEAAARRSLRRAEYAMEIRRAVLRWNGVVIPGNPLGRETAGHDRNALHPGIIADTNWHVAWEC